VLKTDYCSYYGLIGLPLQWDMVALERNTECIIARFVSWNVRFLMTNNKISTLRSSDYWLFIH
jgi:hypothetical protein